MDGQPADPDRATAALLGHLGILGAIQEARPCSRALILDGPLRLTVTFEELQRPQRG